MRQAKLDCFSRNKGMLPWFGMRMRQVLPERFRLALTDGGNFRIRVSMRVIIRAVPDFVVGRLRVSDQV